MGATHPSIRGNHPSTRSERYLDYLKMGGDLMPRAEVMQTMFSNDPTDVTVGRSPYHRAMCQERALLIAIVEDALDCARARRGTRKDQGEALDWFFSTASGIIWKRGGRDRRPLAAYTFVYCCEQIGIDPDAVRRQLRGERVTH